MPSHVACKSGSKAGATLGAGGAMLGLPHLPTVHTLLLQLFQPLCQPPELLARGVRGPGFVSDDLTDRCIGEEVELGQLLGIVEGMGFASSGDQKKRNLPPGTDRPGSESGIPRCP